MHDGASSNQSRQVRVAHALAHVPTCAARLVGAVLRYRCARCRVLRYCCTDCQRADWLEGRHRQTCYLLRQGSS